MPWIKEAYARLDRSPRALRRFGLQIGVVLLLSGIATAWRHRIIGCSLGIVGAIVIGLAEFSPTRLRYFHQGWMSLSFVLGEIVSPVLLTIVFYLALTPIGLLQRIFGKRDIELAFKTSAKSYWKTRSARRSRPEYENQF